MEQTQSERDARIALLEARLQRRSGVGVKPFVSLLGIACALSMLWMMRADVAYLFASRTPLQLGSAGEYHFDRLRPERYAQVHGLPTRRGAYAPEGGKTWVVVGLQQTPLLVRRESLPGESWTPGSPPPQPDQRPFAVGGRLVVCELDASGGCKGQHRFEDGFRKLLQMQEVRPLDGKLWMLLEGVRPGEDRAALAWATGLIAFAILNAWLLARELRHRFKPT
jgi:hypothetical protein